MSINRIYCCLNLSRKGIINQLVNINIRQISTITHLVTKPNSKACRSYSTHITDLTDKPDKTSNVSLVRKVLNKMPFINTERSRLGVVGYLLYESIADKISYVDFFDEFNLPDTFYSWFVVTELHVWMLMVRCMAEGEDGRYVRNRIVEALWTDVGLRVKKLGAANPAGTRAQVRELSEQLQAAIIAYDEGLQSDDAVLAGAVWRRMYQRKEVDPENLELLVKYIRKHLRMLDNINKDELFSQRAISWESIHEK